MITPEQWEQMWTLFERIRAAPPDQRAELLDNACGSDPELRREVEGLLAREDIDENFLTPPPPPPVLAGIAGAGRIESTPESLVGEQIDGFLITRVLDWGGMGTVYLAQQEQPRREVALKLLHAGLLSSSIRQRFEYEGHFLARLQHPGIAQVYQVGEHGGRPFIAMEYVRSGQSITAYCTEHSLSQRQRLELFCQVCEAVHYGHQRGIIHRDLKPPNILVDVDGQVKVIDFGVARVTDADATLTTMHTGTGQMIGTVQYMSPEQCGTDAGDVDIRSDVYSLGVVLYELLCGQLPYDVGNTPVAAAARMVCEAEPPSPSSLSRMPADGKSTPPEARTDFQSVRGDLEHIVLASLAKKRDHRYQSAADLLRDIRHHLAGEPIEARKPSGWVRMTQWLGRHPIWATTGICLFIAAAVLVGTLWSVHQLNARPHRIWISPDGSEARLLTYVGGILQSWPAEADYRIQIAALADRPAGLGGGKLALLSRIGSRTTGGRFLFAFDPSVSLDEPLWTRGVEPEEILPELLEHRNATAAQFGAHHTWLLDVFPENEYPEYPGDEIVVTFSFGYYSARVIRIYDLGGNLLYEVWHDGTIGDPVYLPEKRLLVFSGDCHLPYWTVEGELMEEEEKDFVIFALRPEPGQVGRETWLPLVAGDHPLAPVWYKRLASPDTSHMITGLSLGVPDSGAEEVRVTIHMANELRSGPLACWLHVDSNGETVEDSQGTDNYLKQFKQYSDSDPRRLPSPDLFSFESLPADIIRQAEIRRIR